MNKENKCKKIYALKDIVSIGLMPILLSFVLTSCLTQGNGSKRSRSTGESGISNTPNSVSVGNGRILHDNPIILSGNPSLSPNVNLNTLLKPGQDSIVNNQFLIGSCTSIDDCFQAKFENTDDVLQSSSKKWAFNANSDEFAQVNLFGHIKLSTEKFHSSLISGINLSNQSNHNSSLPGYLTVLSDKAHWNGDSNNTEFPILTAIAECSVEDNAFFSPSTFQICFGRDSISPALRFAHDNTVIYHELGHAYVRSLMNINNLTDSASLAGDVSSSELGYLLYDEAGAINEGIADYISFFQNGRTHFGEWALGRLLNASRPMSEDDPLHAPGISTTIGERLLYPQYVNYNPNSPTNTDLEDIHLSGSIIAHYLVALNNDLIKECGISKSAANDVIILLLSETLAELGDLTTKGNLNVSGSINLNATHAFDWIRVANPVTFRKFAQSFAKYQKLLLTESNIKTTLCSAGSYTVDNIEFLLDQYGLLLFKTYNEDGNEETNGHAGTHTAVSTLNRVNSVLIQKENLIFDPEPNATKAFVFDSRSQLRIIRSAFKTSGTVIEEYSDEIEDDLPFNNANGKISPGEFLGISLNLFNNSNSIMAGVQILANDWDHTKDDKPCNTFADNFPSEAEGAADLSSGEGVAGGCDYITRSNGDEAAEELAPVCFALLTDGNSTRYGSQEDLRQNIALSSNKCLSGSSDTKDCFIKFPRGLDQSYFSKIDPGVTFRETIATEDTSQLLFMEVSPWIPPGTTFNCRFRARFTNCEDCYHDSNFNDDDFLDYEYAGGDPFQIIHFEFTVTD